MEPDFSRVCAPKDKVHIESSHRSLHNFEIRIIKTFENRIVKTEPGDVFKNGKREKITVTLLDVDIEELRKHNILESYRKKHNDLKHNFSGNGRTTAWIPEHKLENYLSKVSPIEFSSKDDGLLIGEALCQKPFEKPVYPPEDKIESNEVELIAKFLEQQGMVSGEKGAQASTVKAK